MSLENSAMLARKQAHERHDERLYHEALDKMPDQVPIIDYVYHLEASEAAREIRLLHAMTVSQLKDRAL